MYLYRRACIHVCMYVCMCIGTHYDRQYVHLGFGHTRNAGVLRPLVSRGPKYTGDLGIPWVYLVPRSGARLLPGPRVPGTPSASPTRDRIPSPQEFDAHAEEAFAYMKLSAEVSEMTDKLHEVFADTFGPRLRDKACQNAQHPLTSQLADIQVTARLPPFGFPREPRLHPVSSVPGKRVLHVEGLIPDRAVNRRLMGSKQARSASETIRQVGGGLRTPPS
jgi:hypothetical protein